MRQRGCLFQSGGHYFQAGGGLCGKASDISIIDKKEATPQAPALLGNRFLNLSITSCSLITPGCDNPSEQAAIL